MKVSDGKLDLVCNLDVKSKMFAVLFKYKRKHFYFRKINPTCDFRLYSVPREKELVSRCNWRHLSTWGTISFIQTFRAAALYSATTTNHIFWLREIVTQIIKRRRLYRETSSFSRGTEYQSKYNNNYRWWRV